MSAISTTSLSSIAPLLSPETDASAQASKPLASSGSESSTGSDRGPATNVQLSDHVKAILTQATNDRVAADRLQEFVASRQTGSTGRASPASDSSKTDRAKIDTAFEQLSGGDAQATDNAPAFSPVEPAHNFSSTLQAAGFSISVTANAETGAFSTIVNGPDGLSFFDKRFGQNGEVSGISGLPPGASGGETQAGNIESFTFTQNEAAAENVTTATNAGVTSASAAVAQSTAVTIAIDFNTGSIRLSQTEVTASATAQLSQSTSPLSILA
jgi:hypothetical protein